MFVKELYRYRQLIWSLVIRDLKARYRGSLLGFIWTFLNPLLLMLVYVLVFLVYMRIEMENYAVFLFCGLIPWIWFSSSLMEGVNSVIAGGSLITRSMLSPEVFPTVKVVSNLINFLLSLPLLFFFIILFKIEVGSPLLAFPIVILVQLIFTMGLVAIVSALNVRFRDLQHILGIFLTLWFFISPILYPLSSIPEEFRVYSMFNPIAIFSMAYQDILFYNRMFDLKGMSAVLVFSITIYIIGTIIFNRYKESFAEEI